MITLHLMPTLTDRVTRLRDCFSTFNYAQRLLVHYVNNLQFPLTLFSLLFKTFSTFSNRSRFHRCCDKSAMAPQLTVWHDNCPIDKIF